MRGRLHQIIDLRPGSRGHKQCMAASHLQKTADNTVRIFEISKIHAMCRADGNAGWIQALINAMKAKCAFVGIALRMNEAGIVRACGHTGFAANAFLMINKHNAAPLVHVACAARATVYARRVAAMIAAFRTDFSKELWKSSLRFVGDPVSIESFRHAVFGLTGGDTVHAPHTFHCVDHHCIARHDWDSSGSKVTKLTFMPVPPMRGSVAYRVISAASLAPTPKACLSPLEV